MTRMFLSVPRDSVIPEGHSVTYLPDGTMVDFDQDVRCGTCKWWQSDDEQNYCCFTSVLTDADHGCTDWEARHG